MLKRHTENTIGIGLDMGGVGPPKMLKLENFGYNVEGHREIHPGCLWWALVVLKMFYIQHTLQTRGC
jgi:hypothetical protein